MSKKTFAEAVLERAIRNGDNVSIPVTSGNYHLSKEVSGLEKDKKLETPAQIKWKVAEINGKTVIMAITPIKVAVSRNSGREVQDVADEICRELFSSELFQSVENFKLILGFGSRKESAAEVMASLCKTVYGDSAQMEQELKEACKKLNKQNKGKTDYWIPTSCCGSCYSEIGWKSDTIVFALKPVAVLKDGVTVENYGTGEKLGEEGHPWILSVK